MKIATICLLLATVVLIFFREAIERKAERMIEDFDKEQRNRGKTNK